MVRAGSDHPSLGAKQSAVPTGNSSSVASRAIWGALFGAILCLLALPQSRSFLTSLAPSSGPEKFVATAPKVSQGAKLVSPIDIQKKALWVNIAYGRLLRSESMGAEELSSLQNIARTGAAQEPDNSYWRQALAILALKQGNIASAIDFWNEGSRCLSWNDHQTDFLVSLGEPYGPPTAATLAISISLRNANSALAALEFGKSISNVPNLPEKTTDTLRLATFFNGELIRLHAKSIAEMNIGVSICDSSLKISSAPDLPFHKELIVAQVDLSKLADELHYSHPGSDVMKAFRENEAAVAMTSKSDTRRSTEASQIKGLVTDLLPSALLFCFVAALIGVGVLTFLNNWTPDPLKLKKGLWSVAIFVTLFGWTLVPASVAIAFGLSILFSTLGPKHVRTKEIVDEGPLFNLSCYILALFLVSAVSATLIVNSGPMKALGLSYGFAQLSTYSLVLSFAMIAATFLFLIAPLWAFATRSPTKWWFMKGLRRTLVAALFFSALFVATTTPLAYNLDKLSTKQLGQILTNEPVYYLLQ